MTDYLDQIEALNPHVNAIVALRGRSDLMSEAAACDLKLSRREPVGLLHGFPHAVKDLSAVKGLPFVQGSPIHRNVIAQSDALPVERLRKAGAIFIGKTNTPEFGLGSHTYNPVYGVTRNAYDLTKSAGGSSGGAAVALALHMLPVADGSDYGGSLRNPAGWNNVYGFRTSIGRIAVHVKDDWLPSMSVAGPMARNVDDLAMLLSVQAGYDSRAPLSMESSGDQFLRFQRGVIKGKRIAWSGDFGGYVPYQQEVLEVCKTALKSLEGLGCLVEEAYPKYPFDSLWQSFIKLRGWQVGAPLLDHYRDPVRRAMLKPEAVWEIEQGLGLSAYDVGAHSIVRTEWSEVVREFFERYDYWIVPTAQLFPFDINLHWPSEIEGRKMQTYHEWMKAACLVSMAGCPSLAIPAGFGLAGLPIGVQIVAPVHHELDCLNLAAAYEAASRTRLARPSPLLLRA
jgi:amidase